MHRHATYELCRDADKFGGVSDGLRDMADMPGEVADTSGGMSDTAQDLSDMAQGGVLAELCGAQLSTSHA